jgi:hypothetical protein
MQRYDVVPCASAQIAYSGVRGKVPRRHISLKDPKVIPIGRVDLAHGNICVGVHIPVHFVYVGIVNKYACVVHTPPQKEASKSSSIRGPD